MTQASHSFGVRRRSIFALGAAGAATLFVPGCSTVPPTRPLRVGGLFAGRIDDKGFMESGWRGLERGTKPDAGKAATPMKLARILISLLTVAIASMLFWASLDRPLSAPDWKGPLKGVSYSPSRLYSEEQKDETISVQDLRRDLGQLAKVTKRVRTYEVSHGRDRIPAIAKEHA